MKKERIVAPGSVAVVTGASSGIGQHVAEELAKQGMHVYALARSLSDYFLDPAHHEKHGTGFIRQVKCDITKEPEYLGAINSIIQNESRLDCLIQAAGFGLAGSVEDTDSSEARQQMETIFFGSVLALPAVLKQMRSQRRGMIVQVGSVAGALPIPFQAYYSAGKAAVTALILASDIEVRPFGIRCMLIQPGDTQTGFTQARIMAKTAFSSDYQERCRRSIKKMSSYEEQGMLPEIVARGIVRRMKRRNPPLIYTPGFFNKLFIFLNRILPVRLVLWIISLVYAK